jgi:hypothetical protein
LACGWDVWGGGFIAGLVTQASCLLKTAIWQTTKTVDLNFILVTFDIF